MLIVLLLTTYSAVSVAVPSRVNSIEVFLPETVDNVAVNVTSVVEFSPLLLG
jgi:hypothetical protein